jgi:hypothetical protein
VNAVAVTDEVEWGMAGDAGVAARDRGAAWDWGTRVVATAARRSGAGGWRGKAATDEAEWGNVTGCRRAVESREILLRETEET